MRMVLSERLSFKTWPTRSLQVSALASLKLLVVPSGTKVLFSEEPNSAPHLYLKSTMRLQKKRATKPPLGLHVVPSVVLFSNPEARDGFNATSKLLFFFLLLLFFLK